MKKKFISVKLAFFCCVLFLFLLPVSTSAATVSVNSFDLVDSSKHLDYDGNSIYMSYVRTAASTWNAYKSGVIRPDSLTVVEDVYCSDYSESSGIDAYTTGGGAIWFNTRNLGSKGSAEKLNVATHELGHALGLGYNQTTDVMYMYTSTRTTLSANDKASYDAASILY